MKYLQLLFIALLYPLSSPAYSHLSPYSYCGGDPVNCVDPTGCVIEGVTKKDASMAVEDFRAMFPGDEFADFRNLIVQSGKKHNGRSFATISTDVLATAFSGITLNEDQQALVDMVVNTINSDDVHSVEYLTPRKDMSRSSLNEFLPQLNLLGIYIADGDTICDVSILDGKGTCISTTCPKSAVIKWAFDNITNEETESSVKLNNNYNPLYYKLSIINDSSQTILSSSLLLIEYNDDVKEKIEELKAFIIRLWENNCIKENGSADFFGG